MRRHILFRWVAALTLAIAVAPSTAPAQEDDTLTISSTFYMYFLGGTVGADLAEVYANGHEHTWTLTLHGATQSNRRVYIGDDINYHIAMISATSFDLEFFGPDAATLNGVVSEHIAGGSVYIELAIAYYFDFEWDYYMTVWVDGPDGRFFEVENFGPGLHFPSDADGYPVVGPEPFSVWSQYSYLYDVRSGNFGYILSQPSLVTFAGGEPDPGVPVVLAIADASVREGDGGTIRLDLTVTLSRYPYDVVTVDYQTADGTARKRSDYTATSGTLLFWPGEPSRTISVAIKGDSRREADETFSVNLSNAAGATIADGVATVTILNDD